MKRLCIGFVFLAAFLFTSSDIPDGSAHEAYAAPDFSRLSLALQGLRPSEISTCVSFVKKSEMSPGEMADAIYGWNPDEHKKNIAAVFRNRITRISDRLKSIDYEKLIIDIDLIKNSHMTTSQIVRVLRGLKRR